MSNRLTRLGAAALFSSLGVAQAAEFHLVDLGEVKSQFSGSAHGMNASGAVVGAGEPHVGDRAQAFLYRHGRAINLAGRDEVPDVQDGFATAINNNGLVTGSIRLQFEQEGTPFVEDHGKLTLLSRGLNGHGEGDGINNVGDVVGRSRGGKSGKLLGFAYQGGHWTTLRRPDGVTDESAGLAINDDGLVAGWTSVWTRGESPHRAAIWRDGVLLQEPDLGGDSSEARAVSASGDVVGFSATAAGPTHAFRVHGGNVEDLNGSEFFDSLALGINPGGTVVVGAGGSLNLKHQGGIVVIAGKMRLLDNMLVAEQRAQWHVDVAWSVNDAGQIAGIGTYAGGQQHAILLNPVAP